MRASARATSSRPTDRAPARIHSQLVVYEKTSFAPDCVLSAAVRRGDSRCSARLSKKRLNAIPPSAITRQRSRELPDRRRRLQRSVRRRGDLWLMEIKKGTRMRIKASRLAISFVAACVVLAGAAGIARAADEWFVLAEKPIKTADQGVEIKSEGGRWEKDVKKTKLSVAGADVEIVKVILHWDNRGDDTI